MKKYLFILILTLVACSTKNEQSNVITVTIEPYRYIVESIAGNAWNVRTLLSKGANPETADLTPSAITSLANSKAYMFVGGLGFEKAWLRNIAEVHPGLLMVDTSQGVPCLADDPHLWTSPDNMSLIADNVCNALCELDSAGHEGYCSRLHEFKEMLHRVDSVIAGKLADSRGKGFVIFHPSLTYFSRLYGLNQLVMEHHGKEPTVSHFRALVDSARTLGVKHVFVQQEFHAKLTETVASELGARIVNINPLNYDWQHEILHIANSLCND